MNRDLLAQVDWTFLVLAGFVLLMLVTWPFFRRMARDVNLGFVEGDMAKSGDAALRMLRSWLPLAVLERWLNPGHTEVIISERYRLLGETEEAVRWGTAGLRKARKPTTILLLRNACALAHAHQGRIDLAREHLDEARKLVDRVSRRTPHRLSGDDADASTAIFCFLRAGQIGQAARIADEALAQSKGPPSIDLVAAALDAWLAAGEFNNLISRTAWMIETRSGTPSQPVPADVTSSVGISQLRQTVAEGNHLLLMMAAASAARHAGWWDWHRRYLHAAAQYPARWPPAELALMAEHALLAAHEGRREDVAGCVQGMGSLAGRYPRDHRLRGLAGLHAAEAWQALGEHQRALEAAPGPDARGLNPLERSELAAIVARSLEALGRQEEA